MSQLQNLISHRYLFKGGSTIHQNMGWASNSLMVLLEYFLMTTQKFSKMEIGQALSAILIKRVKILSMMLLITLLK